MLRETDRESRTRKSHITKKTPEIKADALRGWQAGSHKAGRGDGQVSLIQHSSGGFGGSFTISGGSPKNNERHDLEHWGNGYIG